MDIVEAVGFIAAIITISDALRRAYIYIRGHGHIRHNAE